MNKWVKFYKTGSSEVKTLRLETMEFESEGQTHMFTDPEDARSKSTTEVVIFWDDRLYGQGLVEASV